MREQKGYLFHRGRSWFIRYWDSARQENGALKRVQFCKKIPVEYGGAYTTKKSVKIFADEVLRPINNGTLCPNSTMTVAQFVERAYFPQITENVRASTLRGYRDIWSLYLREHPMCKMALRDFRTFHGQQILSDIARRRNLSKNSLKHLKAFLSGVFGEAIRQDILRDALNPMREVKIPRAPDTEDTYAYSPDEVTRMLAALPPDTRERPTRTIVLTAALTGLRKSELRGLQWDDYNGRELRVNRSVWNKIVSPPKTRRSRAPIPVPKCLADALNLHRQRMGTYAFGPIFQVGTGKPLSLDNLAKRVIRPALKAAGIHWDGWHAFRRGVGTNLNASRVDDVTIQGILRHTDVRTTLNIYVKSVPESRVTAMNLLGEKLENGWLC